nr:hypothetical protein Iba_chr05aCG10140 [Ipomoea batatas]
MAELSGGGFSPLLLVDGNRGAVMQQLSDVLSIAGRRQSVSSSPSRTSMAPSLRDGTPSSGIPLFPDSARWRTAATTLLSPSGAQLRGTSATDDEREGKLRATFSVFGSSLHPSLRFFRRQLQREGIFATDVDGRLHWCGGDGREGGAAGDGQRWRCMYSVVCGLQSERGSMAEGGDGHRWRRSSGLASEVSVPRGSVNFGSRDSKKMELSEKEEFFVSRGISGQ